MSFELEIEVKNKIKTQTPTTNNKTHEPKQNINNKKKASMCNILIYMIWKKL